MQEYHHTTKEVSNRGLFKGVTAITSAMIDIFTLPINLTIAATSPALKNIDDPLQKALDKVAPDFVTDNLDYDKLRKIKLGSDPDNPIRVYYLFGSSIKFRTFMLVEARNIIYKLIRYN